jgi:hypothetical protein
MSRFRKFRLQSNPSLSIDRLCRIALDDPNSGWTRDDGDPADIASHIVNVFVNQRRMLDEYFSIVVSEDGDLLALPQVV